MAQIELNNNSIDVNDEGYFLNPEQWNEDLAHEMAKCEGITLTDKHFEVIQFLRDKQSEGVALTIRKVGKSGICSIKEFYTLFPGGPLKISSKISGIPKPVSCV